MSKLLTSISIGLVLNTGLVSVATAADGTRYTQQPPALAIKAKRGVVDVDLSFVRDWGLIIQIIRQLSVDLYLESTRKKVSPESNPIIVIPSEIPDTSKINDKDYQPPRKEWIAYYLTCMEPVSALIHDSLKAGETGTARGRFPAGIKDEIQPVRKKVISLSYDLEKKLDSLHDLFDEEQTSNKELATLARAINKDILKFEKLRRDYFEIIRKAEKKGVTKREVLPRPQLDK